MDAKKLAIVLGIAILLPLFLGLFIDAVFTEPQYNDFCKNNYGYGPTIPAQKAPGSNEPNCTAVNNYNSPQYQQCINDGGQPQFNYSTGCEVFEKCDYCNKAYQDASASYNRTVFFILAPIGLIIVILGIYLVVEYLGAGLMFAGLITMSYATIRYFSNLSKVLRALVILIELLIIMWIAYKKIGARDEHKTGVKEETKVIGADIEKRTDVKATETKTMGNIKNKKR